MSYKKMEHIPSHIRAKDNSELSNRLIAVIGNKLFAEMFQNMMVVAMGLTDKSIKLPFKTDSGFIFETLDYCPDHSHIQDPHVGIGYYKENNIHFTFEIRKEIGRRELLGFEILSTNSETKITNQKKCSCSWDLVKRDGCHCGAITRYKPVY